MTKRLRWVFALCFLAFTAQAQAAGAGYYLFWPGGGVQTWYDTLAAADAAGKAATSANMSPSSGAFTFGGPYIALTILKPSIAVAAANYWSDDVIYASNNQHVSYFTVTETICADKYVWDDAKHQCVATISPCPKGSDPVGKPCDPGTGNEHYTETDFTGTGPFPLTFSRTYNSMITGNGRMGFNWVSSFGDPTRTNTLSVNTQVTPNFASVPRPNGDTVFFRLVNGIWSPDADVTDSLARTTNGWTYTLRNGTVETYDNTIDLAGNSSGRLISISNSAGLSQAMTYDPVTGYLEDGSRSGGKSEAPIIARNAGKAKATGSVQKPQKPRGHPLATPVNRDERIPATIPPFR